MYMVKVADANVNRVLGNSIPTLDRAEQVNMVI